MIKSVSTLGLAEYVYQKCIEKNVKHIGHTKIQKLLYIIYGINIANDNHIIQEKPIVMRYGPVFESLLDYIQKHSLQDLEKLIDSRNLSNSEESIVEDVIEVYKDWSANALSEWSHERGSPWDIVKQKSTKWGEVMPDDLIKNYFTNIIKK